LCLRERKESAAPLTLQYVEKGNNINIVKDIKTGNVDDITLLNLVVTATNTISGSKIGKAEIKNYFKAER
jgi:hypothetical protein